MDGNVYPVGHIAEVLLVRNFAILVFVHLFHVLFEQHLFVQVLLLVHFGMEVELNFCGQWLVGVVGGYVRRADSRRGLGAKWIWFGVGRNLTPP